MAGQGCGTGQGLLAFETAILVAIADAAGLLLIPMGAHLGSFALCAIVATFAVWADLAAATWDTLGSTAAV